jgi:hypothetical protein
MSSIVKLNVLTRLIIGFSALFIITTSVSFYSILKLKQFNGASVHMLETGDKLLEYKDRLSGALLSEVSYEKKFVIAKDNLYYDRFLEAGKQFELCLREAAGVSGALDGKEILDSIGKTHARYVALIQEERGYITSGRSYQAGRYKAEKEIVVEALIKEIKRLELYIAANTKAGTEGLARSGTRALRTALIMALFSLFFWCGHCGGALHTVSPNLSQ